MKKLFTLITLTFISLWSVAQNDTLLIENFDIDPSGNTNFITGPPIAVTNDINWYNYDADGLADFSNQSRPGEWFWRGFGFADADSADGCMFSNSWTLDALHPVKNYLITPAIQIIDANATVNWASAPRQTPHYLDGYVVVVSTTTNDETQFTDTLFTAEENEGHIDTIPGFSNFYFIPNLPGAFIHGLDGSYIEYQGDSIRFIGIQRPFTASLASYSGQTIYIAFVHFTHDDNLLSLDDILVKGTSPNSVNVLRGDEMKLYSYPNPANRKVNLNFMLNKSSDVVIRVTDILGNEIVTQNLKNISGKCSFPLNTENLSAGTYYYSVTSDSGRSTNKFIVIK